MLIGPQTQLALLFTSEFDQCQPLRASTLDGLRELKPVLLRQAEAHQVNPMLITAGHFYEIKQFKPGESPLYRLLRSGEGPSEGTDLRIGTKPSEPAACESNAGGDHLSPQSIAGPRYEHHSAGSEGSGPKLPLCLPESLMLQLSRSYLDAKTIAALTYLHNGKLVPNRGGWSIHGEDWEIHELTCDRRRQNPDITV